MLTSAYASLAAELTRKEIKSVGGYTLGRVIGEGAFGKVYIGIHRLTNTRVAIKQVPKSVPFTSDPSSPLSLLTREIHHHRRLRHPHILALYEIIATESSIYLITELCTGGELFDYLVEKGRLSSNEARRVFGQLVLGVAHLHQSGVVHQVDIWSLGVILFTLLTGSLPFDDDDEGVMKDKILKCEYDIPTWLDEDAADLVQGILQLDPLRRTSLKAMLAHPFFTRSSTTTTDIYHSITSSDISDSSFFSASDSDLGLPRSGATTPITSEEDGSDGRASSAVRDGKRKALDQTSSLRAEDAAGGGGLRATLRRNESETTIRRGLDESTEEEDTDDERGGGGGGGPGRTDPIPIPLHQSYLSLSAPPLQRNVSASSTGSHGSQGGGGSPVPVHTRTPSRTKRHSVGSAYSERLFSLDEEAPPTPIDYLALLSTPSPNALSTTAEKELLDSLTTLGFDTGQIIHSIMTDACDSSGAIWWMLKRKLDAKAREKSDNDALNREIVDKAKKKALADDVAPSSSSRLATMDVPEVNFPTQTSSDEDGEDEDEDHPPASSPNPSYYTHQPATGSHSAPLLDHFPSPTEPSSPTRTRMVRSKSKDHLGPRPKTSPNMGSPTSPSLSLEPPLPPPKSKHRTRSHSVSILARATSALGSTLALKKSTDAVKDEAKSDEGGGRATPPTTSRFGRKSSVPDDAPSPPPSPRRSHADQQQLLDPSAPGTPSRKSAALAPQSSSPAASNADSQDTFDTVTSGSSPRLPSASLPVPSYSNTPAKKSTKGMFSNFKMWFGDDRRKRNNSKRQSSSHPNESSQSRGSNNNHAVMQRRGSRSEGMRADMAFVGSPLKRPVTSRRSSNGSIVPPSRRSSMNSVHRGRSRDPNTLVTPIHHRRRSDSSRASTSDLDASRPASVRSVSGGVQQLHHSSKAGSVSSIGSAGHQSRLGKDVSYRRPPTTTTVRRLHSNTTRHSRNRSGGSSVTRHSSSSSVGETGDDTGELEANSKSADPIYEEDETGEPDEEDEDDRMVSERQKAFKKLSGDWGGPSSRPPSTSEMMHLNHSTASRLSLDSRHSSSGRHSPTVFSAHKTRHVFGAPSQPSASSLSSSLGRRSSHATLRQPLRDVFAAKEGDGDWVDEVDDFGGYGGGLGQASTRPGHRPGDSVSSMASASTGASSLFSATPSSAQTSLGGERDSFDSSSASISLFEGRYAGVTAAAAADATSASWKMQPIRPSAFRSAAVIEEDEEEEEE
ncbi:hypothetical protein RQP46_002040 [Phenoliferia psychrophenolica]